MKPLLVYPRLRAFRRYIMLRFIGSSLVLAAGAGAVYYWWKRKHHRDTNALDETEAERAVEQPLETIQS
jgi:hypothetical protein